VYLINRRLIGICSVRLHCPYTSRLLPSEVKKKHPHLESCYEILCLSVLPCSTWIFNWNFYEHHALEDSALFVIIISCQLWSQYDDVRSSKLIGWRDTKFWHMFLKCGLTKCRNFCWDMLILKYINRWRGCPIGQHGICFPGNNCRVIESKPKELFTEIGHIQRYLKRYIKLALISKEKGSERNIKVISDNSNAKCPDFWQEIMYQNRLLYFIQYYCLSVRTTIVNEAVEESSAPCTQTELLAL